jgi:large subunit ribosomal protein L46
MDTWIVSRNPIGVYKPPISTEPGVSITEVSGLCSASHFVDNEKTFQALFFFKAYILAGQIQPNAEILDFGWFTKKEIRTKVKNKYWHGVKDMLSDF